MFESVELSGFRGVRKCEEPVKLSKFTLLVGANNSGKSTLLEALSFLPVPWSAYPVPLLDASRGEVVRWLHGEDKSLVYRYSGAASVSCALEGKQLKLATRGDGAFVLWVDGRECKADPADAARALGKGSGEELTSYTAFVPNSDVFLARLGERLVASWYEVEKTGAHVKLVKNFVAGAVEDEFTEVSVRFHELVLRKELPGDVAYIRLKDVGDGVERFLVAALWLEAIEPRVVLWDDLEASAHPSLVRAVVEWLAAHDWQVVASTHSADVLREFAVTEPEGGKVIVLRKSRDDVLSHKELEPDEVGRLIDSGQDVRKLLRW